MLSDVLGINSGLRSTEVFEWKADGQGPTWGPDDGALTSKVALFVGIPSHCQGLSPSLSPSSIASARGACGISAPPGEQQYIDITYSIDAVSDNIADIIYYIMHITYDIIYLISYKP